MHIAEGILSPAVLGIGAAVAIGGLVAGLRGLKEKQIPVCGLMAAVFFLASLIHVPVGVSSAHLLLVGLIGMLLGWASYPAIFTGLSLQALLFQYGGLTTLGVNTACMGTAAVCAWYIFHLFASHAHSSIMFRTGAFCAGAFGVALSSLLTSIALAFSAEGFKTAALMLFLSHLPIMIVEGLITMLTATFLARYKPGLLGTIQPDPDAELCLQKK